VDSSGLQMEATFLDTLARAHIANGGYAAARGVLLTGLSSTMLDDVAESDAVAACLLTLAEVHREPGAMTEAHATLDQCAALCEERGLAEVGTSLEYERAQLLAKLGRYKEAYEQSALFHERWRARYFAERFRQPWLHDTLTGLANRRFVEDRLPELLQEAATAGTAVAVALVDIDHFKSINDPFSHDVGDRVLQAVPAPPVSACGLLSPATTGRLSGDLPVTASVGIAVA
jgi:two-component system, cell cycle response regulator